MTDDVDQSRPQRVDLQRQLRTPRFGFFGRCGLVRSIPVGRGVNGMVVVVAMENPADGFRVSRPG